MSIDNGVNVQALLEAREVLKGAPEAAQFTWRASAKWQNGVHSTTTIQNFFGLSQSVFGLQDADQKYIGSKIEAILIARLPSCKRVNCLMTELFRLGQFVFLPQHGEKSQAKQCYTPLVISKVERPNALQRIPEGALGLVKFAGRKLELAQTIERAGQIVVLPCATTLHRLEPFGYRRIVLALVGQQN